MAYQYKSFLYMPKKYNLTVWFQCSLCIANLTFFVFTVTTTHERPSKRTMRRTTRRTMRRTIRRTMKEMTVQIPGGTVNSATMIEYYNFQFTIY